MKLVRIPNLIVAVLLAVLLPLEQAHCLWMGFEMPAAPSSTATAPGHACCAAPSAPLPDHASEPQATSGGCVCIQLPTAVLPVLIEANPVASTVTFLAAATLATPDAAVSIVSQAVLAPDVGNPPLPHHSGAHGLRAPPFFS